MNIAYEQDEKKIGINERTETERHLNDRGMRNDINARFIAGDCEPSIHSPATSTHIQIGEKKIKTNEMKINEKFFFLFRLLAVFVSFAYNPNSTSEILSCYIKVVQRH